MKQRSNGGGGTSESTVDTRFRGGKRMEHEMRQYLKTEWLGKHIIYEEIMDSTNLYAKRVGENQKIDEAVVVAGQQTAGRGRRGRDWLSPKGNCYFSVLLKPDILAECASRLTLVAALALAETIDRISDLQVQIKWPNDIVVNGKKLCGILTESNIDVDGLKYVVIGVGVNANQMEFDTEIESTATSILIQTGQKVDCGYLIATFLNLFEKMFETFVQTQDLSLLLERYNALLVNCNKEVRILGGDEWTGVALGINESGELLVRDMDGNVNVVFAGEVSVRGIYGYV